ncbi:MAG: hypothetical protein SPL61_12040 [Saccharofermentans sp.]|nr:hypothetical protein [Saccharofermentans sp.]
MSNLTTLFEHKSVKITIGIFALLLIGVITLDILVYNQGGYFLLFSLFYVLLPGSLFIFVIDSSFFRRYKAQAVSISYFVGFSLLIIQYYLLNAIGFLFLLKFIPFILSLILSLFATKKLKHIKLRVDPTKTYNMILPYIALSAIIFVACYVSLRTAAPDKSSPIHIDYSYHMGNVNILTRAGNLEDTRVMGMTFKYHYFMDLYYAILRLIFPADIWNCLFRYSILLISPLIAISLFSFAESIIKNKLYCFIICLIIVFFPTLSPRIVEFTPHVINNLNNVGFAFPLSICLTQLLINSYNPVSYKKTQLLIIFLLTFVLTGTKGPFSLILIGTMFLFVIFCSFAKHRISLYQVFVLLTMVTSFAILWFTILNVAMNDRNIFSDKTGIFKYFDYYILLDEKSILAKQAANPFLLFLTIPLSLVENFGGAAIPFIIMIPILFIKLFRKKITEADYSTAFVTICTFVSVGSSIILAMGNNKRYFIMFATPFIYLSAYGLFSNKSKNKIIFNRLKNIILGLSTILLVATIICSSFNPIKVVGLDTPAKEEFDAISWIKENTDADALFAINDHHPGWKYYYYSGFTERRFYLESYIYAKNSGRTPEDLKAQIEVNEQIFTSPDTKAIVSNLGVDYLIYFDRSGAAPELLEENYTLCFSNECLRIYSVT